MKKTGEQLERAPSLEAWKRHPQQQWLASKLEVA
jgi:hypothetical protein